MTSQWQGECPLCGAGLWGDDEIFEEELECPECGTMLKISSSIEWEVLVEVAQESNKER